MVDVQRNVVISLKLAGDPSNQAIAKGVHSQVLEAEKVRTRAVQELRKQSSKAEEADQKRREQEQKKSDREEMMRLRRKAKNLVRERKEQEKAEKAALKERERDQKKADREEMMRLRRKAKNLVKAQKEADRELERAQDEAIKEHERSATAVKKYNDQIASKIRETNSLHIESKQRSNEAAVVAVQGMADMVEGMAKLGLVSEENLQKFMKQYVVVQEGMRIFKGATDVWWKGREALIALSTATKAQTAHNNLLAASNLRVGATQVAGEAVGGAGGAAAGRAGRNLAGDLAGDAVAGGVGAKLAQGVPKGGVLHGAGVAAMLAGELAGAAAAALAIHDLAKSIIGLVVDLGEDSGRMSSAAWGWHEANKQLEKSTKKVTEAELKRESLIRDRDRYVKEETTRIGLQDQLRASANRVNESKGFARNETGLQNAERIRLEAVRDIQAAEAELADRRINEENRLKHNRLASGELALKLLKDREDAQKRLYDAEVNRLNIIRSQNQAIEAALKSDRERLVTLQEQKRLEEKGLNAKLGELNPGLQKMAIGVAEKIKSGKELTLRDINIMKEAGVGQDQIASYYEKKGRQLKGSNTFTEVFGSRTVKNDLADAEEAVAINRQKLIEGKKVENAAGQSVIGTAGNLDQVTQARVKFEAELKLMFTDLVTGLGNSAKDIQNANAAAVDAIRQQNMATLNGIQAFKAEILKGQQEMQKQFEQFQLHQKHYK